ncbi:disease resistance protein, partial [Trifolium medium]|nr:disease resistance protein [Trifolium medium]
KGVNMMRGVPIEVEDPINLLENINKFPYASYTIDALENQNDEILTTDKKQLRESAFLVEDALDEYMIYEERQPPDPGCAALFCEVVDIIKTKFLRHQIKCKYKELESQFHVFCRKYHVEQGQLHSYAQRLIMKNPQRAPLYSDEADIVGIEDPSDKLIDLLLAKKENLTVVCVVGMTGLGKTTLAKKVFDNKEVMSRNFECRVWITMSPTYDIERLLRAMVQELYKQKGRNPPTEISQMPWERLADVVKNLLHQK